MPHLTRRTALVVVLLVVGLAVGLLLAGDALYPNVTGATHGGVRVAVGTAEEVAGRDTDLVVAPLAREASQEHTSRQLVFTARLRLRVDDPRAAMDDARNWVEDHGGFVESMQVDDVAGGARGTTTLRVPQQHFQAGLSYLRGLAEEVLSDQSERADVTARYADLSARLENLKAAESELREILASVRESGGGAEEVLAVHRQLTETRGEIDGLQAQLDTLSEQVALSTIQVTFVPLPYSPSQTERAWRPGLTLDRAVADLVTSSQSLINGLIYFTVALAPFLILLGVAAYVVVRLVRRVAPHLTVRQGTDAPSAAAPGDPKGALEPAGAPESADARAEDQRDAT